MAARILSEWGIFLLGVVTTALSLNLLDRALPELDLEGHDSSDVQAFLERLHRQVGDERVVVFSEDGRPVRLPDDTTVGDLARQIVRRGCPRHTIVVNGAARDPEYILRDGDTILPGGPNHTDPSGEDEAASASSRIT